MKKGADWGDNCKNIGDVNWADVFEKSADVSFNSNFHFKDDSEYKQYEGKIGIYGGTGFKDDKSLAPIPRIISKKVSESTDSSGKLQIVVKVKAQ